LRSQKIALVGGAFGVTVSAAMKTLSAKAKISGLTLIELLVVICVIAVLAAMLLPTFNGDHRHATGVICMVNQKQIAFGFTMWENDHREKFPWQVSTTNNGTMESSDWGYVAPNFNAVADYVKNPHVFVCPTDEARTEATNNAQLHNDNASYFVGLDQGTNISASILTGDRHLQSNGKPVKPGLFVYSNNLNSFSMDWTRELHGKSSTTPFGILSFDDGHVEMVRGYKLNSIFQRQGSITNRLCVP
jgi:prepilin-type N-terminal cleavage/methylation domain-containing protein